MGHVMLSFSSRSWSGKTVPADLSEHRKKGKIPTKSTGLAVCQPLTNTIGTLRYRSMFWLHGSPSGGRGAAFRFPFRFSRFSRIDAVSVTH